MPSKVNGTAKYGIDVQVPGMVYASVLQAPMEGAKAEASTPTTSMKIKGVTQVIPLPFGVAVVGDTVEATRAGVQALKVTWDTSGATAAGFDFGQGQGGVRGARPRIRTPRPRRSIKVGDAERRLSRRRQDPRGGVLVRVHLPRPDGADERRRPGFGGRQVGGNLGRHAVQPLAAPIIAGVLKTTPDKIKIHQQLLGGGFGRRIWPDAPVQAAVISNIARSR